MPDRNPSEIRCGKKLETVHQKFLYSISLRNTTVLRIMSIGMLKGLVRDPKRL